MPSAAPERAHRRTRSLVAVVLLLILAVAGLVLASGRGDNPTPSTPDGGTDTPGATAGPSGTGSATGSPSPSPVVPTETVTPVPTPEPVRVELDQPADLGDEVTVSITAVEEIRGTADGRGEVAGPALRLTVQVRNEGADQVDLSAAVLTVTSGRDDEPAADLSGPGVRPLPAVVAAGQSVDGRYVFSVPPSQRDRVRVFFSYRAERPTAVFTGPV